VLISQPFNGGFNAAVKAAEPPLWLVGTTPLRWTTPK
jgi:hypothetical protein